MYNTITQVQPEIHIKTLQEQELTAIAQPEAVHQAEARAHHIAHPEAQVALEAEDQVVAAQAEEDPAVAEEEVKIYSPVLF